MDARHSEFPVDLEELIFLRQQAGVMNVWEVRGQGPFGLVEMRR